MSMNIHIIARGEVIYPSGLVAEDSVAFNCLQTPSAITYKILESDNPALAYEEWCLEGDWDKEEDVMDFDTWDDSTDYYKVVGKKIVNYRKEHVDEFHDWLNLCADKGFVVEYYAM